LDLSAPPALKVKVATPLASVVTLLLSSNPESVASATTTPDAAEFDASIEVSVMVAGLELSDLTVSGEAESRIEVAVDALPVMGDPPHPCISNTVAIRAESERSFKMLF